MLPGTVRQYPSDLTDAQWELIQHLVSEAKPGGRPRTTNIRQVINAIFFITRTGCAWRYLPPDFPTWKTVHCYFSRWRAKGVWRTIHDELVELVRIQESKNKIPTCTIVDSQSVRAQYGDERGYDGFKKVRGRKRQLLVDTLGFIHGIQIHAANLSDTQHGHTLFNTCSDEVIKNMKIIYADLGYRGRFVEEVNQILGFRPSLPEGNVNSGQGKRKTAREKLENRKLRGVT